MSRPRALQHVRHAQRGLTLIELMVAITITLIVVAALLALFLNVNNSQRELERVNRQIESGRLSVFVLENELSHAGFWENYMPEFDDLTVTGAPTHVPTGALPDPCLPYSVANWTDDYKRQLLDLPVQTYDSVPASCTDLLKNKKAGTDIVVVRHAETCLPGTPNCEADTSGAMYFQSSLTPWATAFPRWRARASTSWAARWRSSRPRR